MTPDQIEAERTKFEAWAEFIHEESIHIARVALNTRNGAYVSAFTDCLWRGWLARAEEQYASEANNERGE